MSAERNEQVSITFMRSDGPVDLLRYEDGSTAIRVAGELAGRWRPSQREQCLMEFFQLISGITPKQQMIGMLDKILKRAAGPIVPPN